MDPAEDGENWYAYCDGDPLNYVDPDGRLSLRGWGVLWGGLKVGFNQYALKTAADVATGIAVGSAIAVCMPAIMPTLPAAIPIIVATASYIGVACDIGPDLAFLVRDFSTVFLSKNPSDRKVHEYGVRVSKVGLQFAGLIATTQGMNAIMRTGVLQKAGIWLKNSGERGGYAGEKRLRDDALVVRGGESSPENLKTNQSADSRGHISANSANSCSLEVLATTPEPFRNGKLSVATVGDIRGIGMDVIPDPTRLNPHHVSIVPNSIPMTDTEAERLASTFNKIQNIWRNR